MNDEIFASSDIFSNSAFSILENPKSLRKMIFAIFTLSIPVKAPEAERQIATTVQIRDVTDFKAGATCLNLSTFLSITSIAFSFTV
jgi:hypothetical protein